MAIISLDDPKYDKQDSDQGRSRVWTFIVWEESASVDFVNILKSFHIPMCISPLHNRDKQTDGTPKKSHWHVIINYTGKKTYEQVKEVSDSVNASFPVRVADIFGLTRYICSHIDDPDKAPYNKSDAIPVAGYDIDFYFNPQHSQIEKACLEIEKFITEKNITEYDDLIVYTMYENDLWYYIIKSVYSNHFYRRIQSRRNKLKGIEKHYRTGDENYEID